MYRTRIKFSAWSWSMVITLTAPWPLPPIPYPSKFPNVLPNQTFYKIITQHFQTKGREVGGGSISYEDDWTFAKLHSSQGVRQSKSGAPTLKHYWNISGQERQRIISCPQVRICPARLDHFYIRSERFQSTKIQCGKYWAVGILVKFSRGQWATAEKTLRKKCEFSRC